MPQEIEIRTPYLRLAARRWGPETGLPVLALHGWLDNAASFDRLAPLLPQYHLIALDLAGHGLSEHRPAGVPYHFIDYIPDVIAAADALGWGTFALLGHSLGAAIASFVAATIPERIAYLALIEGLGPLAGKPAEGPAVLLKSIRQMQPLGKKRLPVYAGLKEAIRARQKAGDLSWQAAEILVARNTRPVDGGVGWRSDPRLTFTSPIYLTEEQVLAFLGYIRAPTLLILAESGYLVKRDYMTRRYEQVPRLEVKTLLGGHHLHLEDPEPVARILTGFLKPES